MTLSIWRYSHYILAFVSSIFLILASVTGIILAFEPMIQSVQGYDQIDLDDVYLGETILNLRKTYPEVLDIEITKDQYVIASLVLEDGNTSKKYINPKTAEILGRVEEKLPLFKWITNLHRSLFLKTLGRLFVGLFSFLLCFIAITGVFLLAKRQGGFKKWFTRIKEREFNMRYHVILGRWLLLPIIIIAGTGVFLSAEKFSLLPEASTLLNWDTEVNEIMTQQPINKLPFFKDVALADIRKVIFPFSEFPEDFYEITLTNKDVLVHQYTGDIISESKHPFTQVVSLWSFKLHTGEGSFIWSVVLLLASASILFFVYSGTVMFLKRRKKIIEKVKMVDKDQATYIILVGSEGGDTYAFAKAVLKSLNKAGELVYLTTLNEYSTYKKAESILILTSTYGDGDAPTNASNFEKRFKEIRQENNLRYSVVGFGSMDYPEFCNFSIKVDALLAQADGFVPTMPLVKINEQSIDEKTNWFNEWSSLLNIDLELEIKQKKTEQIPFEIVSNTGIITDDTFLLRLKPLVKTTFTSGDLIAIKPPNEEKSRKYSIAKIGEELLLSIKKHDKGKCSTYLSSLQKGASFYGTIKIKQSFHFPKKASQVIFISNGTGIAPFIGMIQNNNKGIPVELYWGGRTKESFNLYKSSLGNFDEYTIALSQEGNKEYVQDILLKNSENVIKVLSNDAFIMICGSISMKDEVLKVLDNLSNKHLQIPITHAKYADKILTDCY